MPASRFCDVLAHCCRLQCASTLLPGLSLPGKSLSLSDMSLSLSTVFTSAEARVNAGIPTVVECRKANFSLIDVGNHIFTEKREHFQGCLQMYVSKAKNKNLFAVSLDLIYFRKP